ncbi:MAG: NAD(P)H-hydrate dehydratase [Nitriliruptorales bacterium]|nr:NAD(P)H-hydrate dehydratase [Nitriliruptorales bacterium]
MIPLYTPAQVRGMDERAVASGTPSLVLMERAAGHLARAVVAAGERRYGLRALFLCGKGNNGGDGLAAARRLLAWGADARVHLVAGEDGLSHDTGVQLARYRAAGGRLVAVPSWDGADVIVDCLLGTGSSGAPREPYASVVEGVNARGDRRVAVVACDLPSGVDADTGQVEGVAVGADVTVSLGAHKRGLWLWPARGYCGDLSVADIGITTSGDEDTPAPAAWVLEDADVRAAVPPAAAAVDKRGRGVVLVVAGSPGMSGAAIMVARGALAMGVGLLTVATPQHTRDVVASAVPEAMTVALPDDPAAAFDEIAARLDGVGALAVGPGLGHDEPTVALVRRLVRDCEVDTVLDADGLNAFRGEGDALAERRQGHRLVCTPHAREFARLLGKDEGEVWPDRVNTLAEAARRWRAEVVAKGPGTIIQSPQGKTLINGTGTAALATGGTGDVLTGMIASATAGNPQPHAAAAAVHIHGLAGRIAAARLTARSVAALDVAAAIPAALADLERA